MNAQPKVAFASFDLETSIHSALKRKASPFYGINEIVAFGVKYKGDASNTGTYFPEQPDPLWFRNMLSRTNMLVGFNIKFDILHAINQSREDYEAWMDWIAEGGRIWCCQLAEYLIHGQAQEAQMLSMDEVAPRYGGNLKNDAVKALWAAGIDTPDIDRDLLMEYLIGTGEGDIGDIGNTERIFLGQVAALRARGGIQSAVLNMGALVFTIEAEHNGMYVDKELGLRLAAQVKADLEAADARMQSYIPADLPFEFKWTSRFHKSALIFGGNIKYVAKAPILDAEGNFTYYQTEEQHVCLKGGTTKKQEDVTEQEWGSEVERFVSGKNKGTPKTKKVKVPDVERGPKLRNEDFFYTFPGYTEGEPQWESKDAEGKGTGVYSTAADVIESLGNRDIPFLKDLAERASLAKDLGTYYITTDEETGEQKGMLSLVGPDGILHHKLNMVNTITGRLSSSDPNLQNVSKGEIAEDGAVSGSLIKTVFKSRFENGKVIQSDFTSLEIYVQGILTQCRQLLEDLRLGLDMHVLRAEQAWGQAEGMGYEEILKAAKDDTHPQHKKWKKKRSNAKVFSFQRAYGAGIKKIAATTGMTEEEVEALVLAEAARYPELDEYIGMVTATIKQNRMPTGLYVQHPEVKGMQCSLGKSHFITPDGKMYSYREQPSPKYIAEKPASKGGTPQSFSPTEIKNYVVQGTGGEWAKAAMWLSVRAFYKLRNFDGRALLVNQVHDAEYCDAAPAVAVEAAALLHSCMMEASTFMEYHFKWTLPIGVPTETKYGDSMMEESNLPDPFNVLVHQYKAWVRQTLIANHTPSFEKE